MPFASAQEYPRVFIVDDDHAVRLALEFALELQGFDVESCESGEALLLQTLPDWGACLVLDERLPGLSGLATLKHLRIREVLLPAILMTSHPNLALRTAARTAGVPILEKPIFGDALAVAIRSALQA